MSGRAAVGGHQRHDPGAGPAEAPPWCGTCWGAVLVPWARIDDGFDDHPKVLALLDHDDGAAAIGLWILCLTWAHRNTRKRGKIPGHVPSGLPRRYLGVLGRDAAKLLVDVGLWDLTEDGWLIHDFDQYLPTQETSAARSDAGKKGAAARWGNRDAPASDGRLPSTDGNLSSDVMAKDGNGMAADGNVMAPEADKPGVGPPDSRGLIDDGNLPSSDGSLLSADGKPVASDGSRAPVRRAISKEIAPTPSTQSHSQNSPSESSGARAKSARATRLPEDFTITAGMREWAEREVPGLLAAGRGRYETDRFIDYYRSASGANARKIDWPAAWRNWMRKAEDDLGRQAPGAGPARAAPLSGSDRAIGEGQALKARLVRKDAP